jgi:hypothetical protein
VVTKFERNFGTQLTVLFQVSFFYRRCLCLRWTWDLPSYVTDKNPVWNVAKIPAWKEIMFVPEHCNICPAVCKYVCVCVSICTNWQRDVPGAFWQVQLTCKDVVPCACASNTTELVVWVTSAGIAIRFVRKCAVTEIRTRQRSAALRSSNQPNCVNEDRPVITFINWWALGGRG